MKRKYHLEIFRLALPNVISNISVPLIGSVDTLLMGGLSPLHLGALGLGGMIFNFLYWNMGFFRMSTTGMVAQAYGRQDDRQKLHILLRALAFAFFISILFIVLQNPLSTAGFWAFDVADAQKPLVAEYFKIRILASPATLGLMVLMGWYFGIQNALVPLFITLVVNLSNIGLSVYFVSYLGWDIDGVAWGTVCAQYIGLLVALAVLIVFFRSELRGRWRAAFQDAGKFIEFFKVNKDIFIRTLMLSLVFAFMYRASSSLGITLLAINTVLFQYVMWMSYGIDGFAYAAESLVGKYSGAGDQTGLQTSMNLTFTWSGLMAMAISIVFAVYFKDIFLLFTDDAQLIDQAMMYRPWIALLPVAGFASYIWDGVFVGLVASKAMRICMTISAVLFFISYFITEVYMPSMAIWLAFMVFLVSRATAQYIYYHRILKPAE